MSWLSSHPLPAYYRESCLDFSAFSSALAVCLSTLSKPKLTHRIESHCKNNKISSKQARFAWIFCQYCQILIYNPNRSLGRFMSFYNSLQSFVFLSRLLLVLKSQLLIKDQTKSTLIKSQNTSKPKRLIWDKIAFRGSLQENMLWIVSDCTRRFPWMSCSWPMGHYSISLGVAKDTRQLPSYTKTKGLDKGKLRQMILQYLENAGDEGAKRDSIYEYIKDVLPSNKTEEQRLRSLGDLIKTMKTESRIKTDGRNWFIL